MQFKETSQEAMNALFGIIGVVVGVLIAHFLRQYERRQNRLQSFYLIDGLDRVTAYLAHVHHVYTFQITMLQRTLKYENALHDVKRLLSEWPSLSSGNSDLAYGLLKLHMLNETLYETASEFLAKFRNVDQAIYSVRQLLQNDGSTDQIRVSSFIIERIEHDLQDMHFVFEAFVSLSVELSRQSFTRLDSIKEFLDQWIQKQRL